ncbi:MAG: transcription termination/antitermination protein NusG [Candidatus Tyloplasma litorale]|nr:MAG: transcription termination/antitermination protein NusG [Mycoplasmatales bacterium]
MENLDNHKWYIVQVVTGYEQKVKEDLENRDFDKTTIQEIFLPLKMHTTKSGNIKSKSMFPGYLYVNVEMTDESWFIIRNTNYVTGIVGSSGQRTKPTPIRPDEIQRIKEKAKEEQLKIKNIKIGNKNQNIILDVPFEINDSVKIKEGEFAAQKGKVIDISIETQKATVEIEFFGRLTQIEVGISLIEKI